MERVDPELQADERTTLLGFLDYHRATFLAKIGGLSHEQMNRRVAPSALTLAGLAKHLALVEDTWLTERFAGQAPPAPWATAPFDDDPDWDFHSAPHDTPEQLRSLYQAACDRSRAVVAATPSLDALSVEISPHAGVAFSLRWILLHLIEETARHNGHADLLREAIDGTVGE